ncbi:MAG TPA: amidohydrolase family protein [Streptosporangiaceae bacterium]|jgi:predicted TIM-barrel fold metal-dependent hydrolase|nr:amidohydrolase family protein [Streptosporangiaceae bacterium]
MPTTPSRHVDAHRHLGVLPAFPFYGGPPVNPDTKARATVKDLIADLDAEGTERALVIPNYGVPQPEHSFKLNELVLEAAGNNDRISAAIWASPRPQDAELTEAALKLAGEPGVKALKISFLLGGSVEDEAVLGQLDKIFATARQRDLMVHIHTSPGGSSDINEIGKLVERYGDDNKIHLVHFGGGMSGHIKLIGGRFFDWITAGKQVYTDLTWSIGFAPYWLAAEIDRRGIGGDRILFATDQPWGDFAGEYHRMMEALGDKELTELIFHGNFERLYG